MDGAMLRATSYKQGLERFARYRWIASIGLLIAAALAYLRLRDPGFLAAIVVTLLIALSNVGHHLLARTGASMRCLILIQFLADLILLTAYLGCTGYPGPLILLYMFHIVLAAMLLDRRDAYFVFICAMLLAAALTVLWYEDLAFPRHTSGFFALIFPPGWTPGSTGMKLRFPGILALVSSVIMFLVLPLVEDARTYANQLKNAEQRAQERTRGLERILNGTRTGLLVMDISHQIRWINEVAALWFPHFRVGEKRECYSSPANPVGESSLTCATCRVLRNGIAWGGDHTIVLPEGPRTFRVYAAPIDEPGGSLLVAEVLIDVSTERERERQLLEARRWESVSHFAAGVAHELNTPLASLATGLGMVDRRIRLSSDEKTHETLDILADLVAQTHRCQDLTNSILGYSRQLQSRLESVEVQGVLHKACLGVRADRDLSGIEILTEICSVGETFPADESISVPSFPAVQCDPKQLRLVFTNVLTNAVDGIRAAGRDKGLIHVCMKAKDGIVEVSVSDNGSGIPPEWRKSVFEPFFTTKAVGQGTGLGLSVARGLLEGMGGSIEVASTSTGLIKIVIRLKSEQTEGPQLRTEGDVSIPRHDA